MNSAVLAAPAPQRGAALSLAPDDTTTEEPPDMNRIHISSHNNDEEGDKENHNTLDQVNVKAASSISSAESSTSIPSSSSSAIFVTPTLASSLDSTFRRAYADRKLSPIIPRSPSAAGSVAESASDYDNEHEPDSPSSLSSWNSWAGGRRGDLADVEDLELDGFMAAEPELETVSELDEESSVYMSGSDRPVADSDDEAHHARHDSRSPMFTPTSGGDQSPRRKSHYLGVHGAPHPHHPLYHHHASHLHPHGTPIHPHFSPRAGGHGLSHASRHLLRAPPNLAARRRKGRLAELAEEGAGGGAISSTKMPAPNAQELTSRSPDTSSPEATTPTSENASPALPASSKTPFQVASAEEAAANDAGGQHSNIEMEIFGPPALPVRSVSPSETVPVVPSPLCVCLTADEQGEVTEVRHDLTPTRELAENMLASKDSETVDRIDEDARSALGGNITPTPPSPTASGRSIETAPTTISTPPTSPPSSPQLMRKGSGSSRNRRASSPGRAKPKFPLRPCFKRRATTEKQSTAEKERLARRDSSSEREKASSRGRTKVRFSQAPPAEMRTHSPVEYDRKACPVSNRLSPEDLEELRNMKMEMGLLEAKCAALAACKTLNSHDSSSAVRFTNSFGGSADIAASSESEGEGHGYGHGYGGEQTSDYLLVTQTAEQRRRADSISSSSPSYYCRNRFAARGDTARPNHLTPAEYLKMEREKERERVCRMAGIGTGVGFRYSGGNGGKPNMRQMPHGGCEALGASSIINRFGLNKPPPLPGMSATSHSFSTSSAPCASDVSAYTSQQGNGIPNQSDYHGGASLYRPSSAPPVRASSVDRSGATSTLSRPNGHQFMSGNIAARARTADGNVEDDDPPRGRQMEKGEGRGANLSSTSTDATLTEADVNALRSQLPYVTRTCPSPTSLSPDDARNRDRDYYRDSSLSPTSVRSTTNNDICTSPTKAVRPNIRPLSGASSSPSYELMPTSSMCSGGGYDSPASEFCYESGSEYDLLG